MHMLSFEFIQPKFTPFNAFMSVAPSKRLYHYGCHFFGQIIGTMTNLVN